MSAPVLLRKGTALKEAKKKLLLVKLANKVSRMRRERGLTQIELSLASGQGSCFIQRVESSRYNPSLMALGALAEALGVTIEELLNFK